MCPSKAKSAVGAGARRLRTAPIRGQRPQLPRQVESSSALPAVTPDACAATAVAIVLADHGPAVCLLRDSSKERP